MENPTSRFKAKHPAKRGDLVVIQYHSKDMCLARAHRIYNGYVTEVLTHPDGSPMTTKEGAIIYMQNLVFGEHEVVPLIDKVFLLENPRHFALREVWESQNDDTKLYLGNKPDIAHVIVNGLIKKHLSKKGLVLV